MKKPEIKNYKNISGAGAYDYVADVNEYINYLESKLKSVVLANGVRQGDPLFCSQCSSKDIAVNKKLEYWCNDCNHTTYTTK